MELVQCITGLLIAKVLFGGCWKGTIEAGLSSCGFCFQKQEFCGYLKLWTLEAVVKGEETKQMVTHNKKGE